MNGLKTAALAALLGGVGLLLYGLAEGSVRLSLFLIVPVLHGSGLVATLGILLLVAAMLLWFAGSVRDMGARMGGFEPAAPEHGAPARVERRSGGMVLLGPIPIVWGSDRGVRKWLVVAGVVMLALWLLAVALLRG